MSAHSVHRHRVLALFDKPGTMLTATTVAVALSIDERTASMTLSKAWRDGLLGRKEAASIGHGKRYFYFLPGAVPAPARSHFNDAALSRCMNDMKVHQPGATA